MYTERWLGVGRRTHEELDQGCRSTALDGGNNKRRSEGRAPAGGNAVIGDRDDKTKR